MECLSSKRHHLVLIGTFVFMVLIASGVYQFLQEPDFLRLNFIQRSLVARIVIKWQDLIKTLQEEDRTILDYELLMKELNFMERFLADRIFAIDPKQLGFKGPLHSTEKPDNLVRVAPADYRASIILVTGNVQYCPRHVYKDYQRMMAAMRKDLGKALFIESAYRSQGMQAFVFFLHLMTSHNFSLYETAHLSALPGYSEHHDPVNNAIDFINEEGIDGDSWGQTAADFEALPEYKWMLRHASEFNFYLSYPRGNNLGIDFEPWHWHWEKHNTAGFLKPEWQSAKSN